MDGDSSTASSLLMLQKPEIRVGEMAHPFQLSEAGFGQQQILVFNFKGTLTTTSSIHFVPKCFRNLWYIFLA